MNEPIAEVLGIAGMELTFLGFSIQALPGFEISTLYKGEQSVYATEIQDFTFNINIEDMQANSLATDMTFTLTDGLYVYSFKLSRNPLSDLTGWAVMYADFIGKTDV